MEGAPVSPIEDWPLPALLRGARSTYGSAIRGALSEPGYDDLPPNGPYVIGAIARTAAPLGSVIRQLGVSKQAAGQLVDTLVGRGYLERSVDPTDRRRLVVRLTPRGEEAAGAVRAAADALEAELVAEVGSDQVRTARRVLATLVRRGSVGG
jgi:DNA-binding MarR family transcriptional regulator